MLTLCDSSNLWDKARPQHQELLALLFMSPVYHVTLKMQETGTWTRLTICIYINYKLKEAHSPWVLVQSGAWTLDVAHSKLSLVLYQLSQNLTYVKYFYSYWTISV